jgi:hypothetical protein
MYIFNTLVRWAMIVIYLTMLAEASIAEAHPALGDPDDFVPDQVLVVAQVSSVSPTIHFVSVPATGEEFTIPPLPVAIPALIVRLRSASDIVHFLDTEPDEDHNPL